VDQIDKPGYYAVIPANVRYDKELSAQSKLIYAEISSLVNAKGYCWATNQYIAEMYGLTKESISRCISQLEKNGYISTQIIKKDKQITERRIFLSIAIDRKNNTYPEKSQDPLDKKVKNPIDEKVKENIKEFNTKFNIKEEEEGNGFKKPSATHLKTQFQKPSKEELEKYFIQHFAEKGFVQESALIQSEKFLNFYDSKNWFVGKNKMKDWKAAVRNWAIRCLEDRERILKKKKPEKYSTVHSKTPEEWALISEKNKREYDEKNPFIEDDNSGDFNDDMFAEGLK